MRPPRSGWAWRPGRDPGRRRFASIGGLILEVGSTLPDVTVAYESWGRLDAEHGNAVLVLHALTGDSHVVGPRGPGHPSSGWWEGMVGPGAAIDTDRFFVVCPNVLGGCQGSTGPASPAPDGRPYGSRFAALTIRDQVAAEAALAASLGIESWAAVIGGSMGAMRALEWCVGYPDSVRRAVVLAVGAAATAEQIALCSLQIQAIRQDRCFAGGDYYDTGGHPGAGMALARGIGQISYRTADELEDRFGRTIEVGDGSGGRGPFAVESYLAHHGAKLVERFDPNSYLVLSQAMNAYDLGRDRGGVALALGAVQARVTVVGIDSDRLYPLGLQFQLAHLLPGSPDPHVVHSDHGHDGFLLETESIGPIIAGALEA